MCTSDPQMPQCVILMSMLVAPKGAGVKGPWVRFPSAAVGEWASQPWNWGGDDVDAILLFWRGFLLGFLLLGFRSWKVVLLQRWKSRRS